MNGLEQIGIARLQVVAECFFLPPEGCVPHWKTRPASHFKEARAATAFNTRFAGRPAGSVRRQDGRRRIIFWYRSVHLSMYAYQVVWALTNNEWPTADIDHRDGNPSNDQPENLRLATASQNLANTGMFAHNTSGAKGVSWDKSKKNWRAYVKVNGRMREVGRYESVEMAAAARKAAAAQAFGEFARESQ